MTHQLEPTIPFELLSEAAPNGLFLVDKNKTILYLNSKAEYLFQYTKDEIVGQNVNVLVPDKSKKKHNSMTSDFFSKPAERPMGRGMKVYGKKRNGELFPIEIGLKPVSTDRGMFVIVSVIDISVRVSQEACIKDYNERLQASIKKVEEQRNNLRLSEKKYENILANLDDVYYRTDNEHKLLFASPSALQYTNASTVDEIIGKNIIDTFYYDPSKRFELLEALQNNNGRIKNYEVVIKGKHNEPIDFSTNSHFILDKDNKIIGVEGVLRNISERKRSERQLKKATKRIVEAHQDITDSISFAKTIQQSLLPSHALLRKFLKCFFLIDIPRDTVSGDFYYVNQFNNHTIFAVADCTGHGVPGAMLTTLGITFLHDAVVNCEKSDAATILETLRTRFKKTFKTFGNKNYNGLDIGLCCFNNISYELNFSGAFRPLVVMRKGQLSKYGATRNPIGYYPNEVPFENHKINLKKHDSIYLFTDGYADQFGGANDRKFGNMRFYDLLVSASDKPMQQQKHALLSTFESWKDGQEQIDDVTVLGIEVL